MNIPVRLSWILLVLAAVYANAEDTRIDVATSAMGTRASASSQYAATCGPEKVINGKWAARDTDKWSSGQGHGPHWLMLDFGSGRVIDQVVIRHEGVYAGGHRYNTSDFSLQRAPSPDGPWTGLLEPIEGNTNDVTTHEFPAVETRYLRLWVTRGAPVDGLARIYAMEVPVVAARQKYVLFTVESAEGYRMVDNTLEALAQVRFTPSPAAPRRQYYLRVNDSTPTPFQTGTEHSPCKIWVPTGGPVKIGVGRMSDKVFQAEAEKKMAQSGFPNGVSYGPPQRNPWVNAHSGRLPNAPFLPTRCGRQLAYAGGLLG